MSRSGVGLSDNCVSVFEELKLGKKYRFVIYKLSDDRRQVVVDQTSTETDYEDFVKALPENDCRWAIYDFGYSLGDGEGQRNKIVFISWSPDNAHVRSKMVYASSKDGLRRALTGIGAEIQGTDFSEISHEALLAKVLKK